MGLPDQEAVLFIDVTDEALTMVYYTDRAKGTWDGVVLERP
jgi:hypothetical protein